MKKNSPYVFFLETAALCVAVCAALYLCDRRRIFQSDTSNDHTGKAWHYLYRYAESKTPIDVIVVGNSHTYCGIIPEMFNERGKRCFLLASNGILADECSYMLEEALRIVKPELVVFETTIFSNYQMKKLTNGPLTDEIHSFESRRNLPIKLKSAPRLFSLENLPYAWSSTLRNHSFLFEKKDLIQYNLKHPKPPVYRDKDYYGRFICFTSGLTEETLSKYEKEGAPMDGAEMVVGEEAEKAARRMLALCRSKGVKTAFLTVPMWRDQVGNVDGMRGNLSKIVGSEPWLFLQDPAAAKYFGPDCFENVYKPNQHQTAKGAVVTTSFLIPFTESIIGGGD